MAMMENAFYVFYQEKNQNKNEQITQHFIRAVRTPPLCGNEYKNHLEEGLEEKVPHRTKVWLF